MLTLPGESAVESMSELVEPPVQPRDFQDPVPVPEQPIRPLEPSCSSDRTVNVDEMKRLRVLQDRSKSLLGEVPVVLRGEGDVRRGDGQDNPLPDSSKLPEEGPGRVRRDVFEDLDRRDDFIRSLKLLDRELGDRKAEAILPLHGLRIEINPEPRPTREVVEEPSIPAADIEDLLGRAEAPNNPLDLPGVDQIFRTVVPGPARTILTRNPVIGPTILGRLKCFLRIRSHEAPPL